MFESFLEKLIINKFGQFISGLDRNKLHLAIWSGNIVIEDVNLKQDILEMFDIPVNLRFSTIGKLQLQIPWSSLSKTPVEIILDKILIIATPKPQKEWKFQDYNSIARKLVMLNDYAKQCISNFVEKQKEGAKKDDKEGFLDKLSMKVLDNLQLTIRNIHFRFEDDTSKFSFGVTLDEIIMITTDEDWKKCFIDRTEEKNKEKPMNKLLSLKNLGIYWNSKEVGFLGNLDKFVIIDKMNRMIMKESTGLLANLEYIINISAEAKLIQNHYSNFAVPEYLISIDLKTIELHLKNEQFEQIIRSFETYIQYNKLQMIERKKIVQLSEDKKNEYRQVFNFAFAQIQKAEIKNMDCLEPDTKEMFKIILSSISAEELCLWAKKALKEMQKTIKVQELEKIKKKNESSWFRWGSNNTNQTEDLTVNEAEYKEIEEFIERSFGEVADPSAQAKSLIRPADKPWFELGFRLTAASIYLSKKNQNNDQEGVKLHWRGFLLNLFNYSNGGLKLELKLEEIGVDMITEYVGNKTPITTPILYKGSKLSRQNFLFFLYEKNPIGRNEDQALTCGIDSMELVYHPLAFNRLFGFFEVKTKDEAFKTAAWEQIEKLSDISQERVQDILANSLKLKVNFEIDAPIIIIPFKHNNDLASECWVIDLGSFYLRSLEDIKEEKQSYYEQFRLKLADMKMQYFPQRKLVSQHLSKYQRKSMKMLDEESKEFSSEISRNEELKSSEIPVASNRIFNVIEEFTIEIEIFKLKNGLLKDPIRFKESLAALMLRIEFPRLQILLNQHIYTNLINLPDTLHFADIANLELLQNEKMSLLNSEIKSGNLKRRGNTYKAWKPYYVIFSGGYLYFFNNQKDLSPVFYIYIKKAEVSVDNEEMNSFVIRTKNEECHLSCDTGNELEDWVVVLKQKIADFSLKVNEDLMPLGSKKKKSTLNDLGDKIENLQEISIATQFHIKTFDLSLCEEVETSDKTGTTKVWATFSLRNLAVGFQRKKLDFELNCKIESLLAIDHVVEYSNKEFQKLFFSQNIGENQSLAIKLRAIESKHPEYSNIDIDMAIVCPSLYINWKPGTLLKLGEYIRILRDYQKTKAEAEIITNPLDPGIGYLKSNAELKKLFPDGIRGSELVKSQDFFKDDARILMKAHFELEEITINFIHKQTHTCLAQGYLSNSVVDLYLKDVTFQIDGRMSNLQIFDMTNYPKTVNSNEKQAYKDIKPYELLGLNNNNGKSQLRLTIISFENAYKDIHGNITTIFYLDIPFVTFKYHHQPIMRIVDYALIQVVSLITDPKYLTLNEEFYHQHEKKEDSKKFEPKKFVGGMEEVLERLNYATFLYLCISFEQPVILMKPTPDSEDYIELTMSRINLESDQYVNQSRFVEKAPGKELDRQGIPELWCENYRIQATDLHIYLNKKSEKKTELAIPVNLNLSVEKVLMSEELLWLIAIKGLRESLSVNITYIIKGLVSPIILKLYRDEYLFIIKMLFHNVTYDDYKDKWFIYDFDIVSLYDPTPITFQLDFLNITLFAMHSKTNMPFSSISMTNMRLKWVRDKQFNVDVYVFGQGFSSNYFELCDDRMHEKGFIGNIGIWDIHEVGTKANMGARTDSFDINKQIYKRYLIDSHSGNENVRSFEINKLNEDKVEFSLKVLMTPRGEKSIVVVFSDVKLLAQTSVYMNLFYFAQLDESCYPSIDSYDILPMSIIWEIKNAMVCIPTQKQRQVLVTRGDINIRYYRYRMENFPALLEKYYKDKNNPNVRERVDSYSYSIEFQKVEIFLCELNDLIKLKFNQVRKRNMILPFTLFYGSKNFISLYASKRDCIYYVSENEFNLEETILRFSFKDLLLFYDALNYQKEEFSKIENWKIETSNQIVDDKIAKIDYLDSDKTSSFTIRGLQICVINDSEESFVPVLDITIYEGQVMILRKNKMVLSALFTTSAFYYNPYVSHWEPILESVGFMIDLNYSEKGNPKIYSVIQMNEKNNDVLNINVSLDMLRVLHKTAKQWLNDANAIFAIANKENSSGSFNHNNSRKFEEFKSERETTRSSTGYKEIACSTLESRVAPARDSSFDPLKRKNSVLLVEEEDIVEYVSPYTIKNETGYPVEIERDYGLLNADLTKPKLRYMLQNGHTMNFQFETDFESIFNKEGKIRNHKKIKFRVLHPKVEFQSIEKIDLDYLRTRKLECVARGNALSFTVLTNLSFMGSGKCLTISSELIFNNSTDQKIQVKLIDSNECDLLVINPGDTFVVPFDKIHKNLAFRFVKEDIEGGFSGKWSDLLNLEKITAQSNKCYELSHDSYFTILKIMKENHRSMVFFEAPYLIKNCLPIPVTLFVISEDKSKPNVITLAIQGQYQEHSISIGAKLYMRLKIQGFKLSERHLIYSATLNNSKSSIIALEDYRTGKGIVEVFMQDNDISGTCKRFFLYSKMFVVNETPYDLTFLYNYEKKKYLVPGQMSMPGNDAKIALSNIFESKPSFDLKNSMSNEQQKSVVLEPKPISEPDNKKVVLLGGIQSKSLIIAFSKKLGTISKEVNLKGVGCTSIELSGGIDGGLYEFGINLSNLCVDKTNYIFSKILRISPRYIIVNRTHYDLQLMQENCPKDLKIMSPDSRLPFFWTDEKKAKQLKLRVAKFEGLDQEIWGWSGVLDISYIGVISFSLRNPESPNDMKFFQGDIRIDNHILYVIFSECTEQNANYLIVNDLDDVDIMAYQSSCGPEKSLKIEKKSSKIYAWDNPIYPKDIRIDLKFDSSQYEAEVITINFDKMDTGDVGREFYVQSKQGQVFPCYRFFVNAFIEGSTKKLRFFKEDPLNERLRKEDKINLQLQINLREIGISLIGDYNKRRLEILYLYLNSTEFIILESQLLRTYQLRVKYFCVDNTTTENTTFPVAFTPTKLAYIKKKDNKFHLDVVVEQNILAKNILLLKSIRADLLSCTIRLNDELIEILVGYFKTISEIFASGALKTENGLVQFLYGDSALEKSLPDASSLEKFEWETTELPANIRYIYISEIVFSPLYFNSSFQRKPKSQKSDPFFVMTFLNALGIALTNIDDAPINLNGIQLSNFFDTIDGIVTKLGLHYKEALLNSLLQVIGSIDILGNPFGLMKHLAVGVFDLIDKPIEGFVKGPLEGGFGIARGAGSFLKNTVAGTFNSVQKITGSFATGISSLSLDDEYLAQREKIKMTKPKHAFDGLGQGMMSIFAGVEKGITGVVKKPYEGYKKGGFGGILKGSIQGIAGLVVKPVAGIFDATSKTAEGIKNTATHFDEKPSDKRQRFLRVFYNKEKYFKSYSKRDSEIMAFLANYKKDKLHNLSLIENFELRTIENGTEFVQFLIFTIEMVLLFEFPKLIFDLRVSNIHRIEPVEDGILVRVIEPTKKLKKKEALIRVEKGKDREYIFEMLTELMEFAREKVQI